MVDRLRVVGEFECRQGCGGEVAERALDCLLFLRSRIKRLFSIMETQEQYESIEDWLYYVWPLLLCDFDTLSVVMQSKQYHRSSQYMQ